MIKCPGLENGTNTVYVPDSLSDGLIYQESYTYSCMEGYNTTDELFTVCQANGALSLATPPNCIGKELVSTSFITQIKTSKSYARPAVTMMDILYHCSV